MDREYFDFLKNAYTTGLCEEYKNEIKACNEDKLQLVSLAMRQQSVPYVATKMHEGIITKDYLLKSFGDYLNGFVLEDCDGVEGYKYAWYVDYDYANDLVVSVDVAHISFTVGASVVVEKTKCPTIYVSNRSKVHFVCEGYNNVRIMLFDTSEVVIEDTDEESTIIVYKYSDDCKLSKGKYCLGKVKEFEKQLTI